MPHVFPTMARSRKRGGGGSHGETREGSQCVRSRRRRCKERGAGVLLALASGAVVGGREGGEMLTV